MVQEVIVLAYDVELEVQKVVAIGATRDIDLKVTMLIELKRNSGEIKTVNVRT